jgi:hypothetical protein
MEMRVAQRFAIGARSDPAEREADAVADQVLANATSIPAISPLRWGQAQRRGDGPDRAAAAPSSVGHGVAADVRGFFESRYQHSFAQVRVHTDAVAHESARALRAEAYTIGHDIYFASGRYAPGTNAGRRLLAHELTHVVQQSGGAPQVQRAPARDLPTAPAAGNVLRWPAQQPAKVSIGPLLRTRGSGVSASGRPSVEAILGPGATLMGLAASLLPIFAAAPAPAPGVDELAKAIARFDEHIFLQAGTPLLRVGQVVPLPIEVDGNDPTEWIVNPGAVQNWAAGFDAKDADVLTQAPAALTIPSAADLDAQIDGFLKDHTDPVGRCIGLLAQLVDNPLVAEPFAKRLFERLGRDDSVRVLVHLPDGFVRWPLAMIATTRAGLAIVRLMGRLLSAPPPDLTADEEARRTAALAMLPQEEPTVDVSPDFLIEGLGDAAENIILFRRGSASLSPATEQPQIDKIQTIATGNPAAASLTLNGSTSEDEAADLALARTATVEAMLQRAGHTAADAQVAPTNRLGASIGSGKVEYRNSRAVEIVLPGGASTQQSCGRGATAEACTAAKFATRETNFTAADASAKAILAAAISAASDPAKRADVQAQADRFFEPGADIHRALNGIKLIQSEYVIAARSHKCDNGCDPECSTATAYCGGVGPSAAMVLCGAFDASTDVAPAAAVLIHETTHATGGLGIDRTKGTADFAYEWQRIFEVLPLVDPVHAWRNADSWAWFIMALRFTGNPEEDTPTSDDVSALAVGNQSLARRGLAVAEKWLDWTGTYTSFNYGQIAERTPRHRTWSGTFEPIVNALAKNFGITPLKTGGRYNVPTMEDQIKVAGINLRITEAWRALGGEVKFAPGSPSSWKLGTPPQATLDAGYFGLSDDDARGREILRLFTGSRDEIAAGLKAPYVQYIVDIRDQYRIDNP